MDLSKTLVEGLVGINYNIAFFGSICSSEEKVKSRRMLVEVLREIVCCMTVFVLDNPTNQILVAEELSVIRSLMGPLVIPPNVSSPAEFDQSLRSKLPTEPGLGAEVLILEVVRENPTLCIYSVPNGLFEEFGHQLELLADPTTSILVEFFETVCSPSGMTINSNQLRTVEVCCGMG